MHIVCYGCGKEVAESVNSGMLLVLFLGLQNKRALLLAIILFSGLVQW